jgi:hypothetical protein
MAEATPATDPRISRAMIAGAVVFGIMIAGTLALWAHYGTAVFYEMLLAGLAACF